MIQFLLTATLLASPSNAIEEYQAGLDARANSLRAREHFQNAAVAFEEQWDAGDRSPTIARNMAQSRLLAGDLGRAISDYRRGLIASPHDRGLQAGLDYAREQIAWPISNDPESSLANREPDSPLDRLALSWTQVAWCSIVLAAVGWFLLVRGWITSRRGWLTAGCLAILLATVSGAWLAWEDHRLRTHWAVPTVVVLSATDLRSGNSDEYPRRVDVRLPAGMELRKVGERGGWFQVELPDGTPGWVSGAMAVEVTS